MPAITIGMNPSASDPDISIAENPNSVNVTLSDKTKQEVTAFEEGPNKHFQVILSAADLRMKDGFVYR